MASRGAAGTLRAVVLVAVVVVDRAVVLVGAALRDGVDEQAAEVALTHVERREEHLEFLHRFERHRREFVSAPGVTRRAEAEHVALGRAVDLHVVHAVRHAAGRVAGAGRRDLRRHAHHVDDVASQRRQSRKRGVGDDRLHARVGRRERFGRRGGDDRDAAQFRGARAELHILRQHLAERDDEIATANRIEADATERHVVDADFEVRDEVAAIDARMSPRSKNRSRDSRRMTFTPARPAPASSVTLPPIAPVVTPCARASAVEVPARNAASATLVRR